MKIKLKYASFLFAFVFLVSCGRSTGDLGGLNDLLPNYVHNRVLSKVHVQKTSAAPYDVHYMHAGSRLMSVTKGNNQVVETIEYDGNQIKKITKKDNTLSQPLIVTSELQYSGTQVAEISGTVSQSGVILETFVTEITYNGDQPAIITTAYYLPGNASAIRTLKSELSYSGFNISKWVYTIDDASIPGSPVVTTTNYSDYDTHQNPFRTLPVPLILSNVHHEGHLVGISALSISNYKTMTVQSSAGSHTENVVLTYNSEGFLETSKQADTTLHFDYIPY
ncbi:hypothetical protein EIZ47_03310 [Chryseobacterium lacus]|uniref:DUF4595 domain-containing protein n=1 Tax=Chryseobacterium lacus TaxID=2058346 RepID=A0A368N366_9FLAO|nr:hypothetical protein [Chryseobacterium lacus]RCU44064.1 hypothetical protein DQ356_03350 [Chryseobacterium lacus]RST28994.1 hypothetical protein EIZ47_03310 [Chryseobacterium lacus]